MSWAALAVPLVIVLVIALAARRRQAQMLERARKCTPLVVFFTEFTKEEASEKRLAQLFDPTVFHHSLEKATLRAMNRCVCAELGSFIAMDSSSCRLTAKRDEGGALKYKASATCAFAKQTKVRCELSWVIRQSSNRALAVSFRVKPSGKDLDVMNYVRGEDYGSFGESFIATMMSKTPDLAFERMTSTLRDALGSSAAVTAEMTKVATAMGGLKDRHLEIDFIGAKETVIGKEPHTRRAIELEYLIQGNVRDAKATLLCLFSGFKTLVVRYTFVGLASKVRHVVVDGDEAATATATATARARRS